MKKMLIGLITILTAGFSFCAPIMSDGEIKKAQQNLGTTVAKDRFYVTGVVELSKKENYVSNFKELKAYFEKHAKAQNITEQHIVDLAIARSSLWLFGKDPAINNVEAYQFMKEKRLWGYCLWILNYNRIKFDDIKLFEEYSQVLNKVRFDWAGQIWFIQAIPRYIRVCSENDPTKAKLALQNLNRKYSPYLVRDKAVWEPIIVQIRVALETY